MNTLTPEIIKKFQPVFSVDEYQRLLKKYYRTVTGYAMYKGGQSKDEYWSKLPEFVLAKCPICGAEHTDWVDLHSTALIEYSKVDVPRLYFYRRPPYGGCEHIVGMATFVNLNENEPHRRLHIESEVPFVTDVFFPEDIKESYAVINAFPICRIEGNAFVPAYTLYIMTYYGQDPIRLRGLRPHPQGLWSPIMYTVDEAWEHRDRKIFDLKYWVEQGRLCWLDEENGKAILRNDADAFPYVDIEGYVENLIFENGEMKVIGHDNPPRYYPTWKPEDWSKQQWRAFYKSKKKKYQPKNRGCLYAFLLPVTLFVLSIVTSLFFHPLIDPAWAWLIMLGGIGYVIYLIVQTSIFSRREREDEPELSKRIYNAA